MQLNIWIQKKVTFYVGGDPTKGQTPLVVGEFSNPQIIIDADNGLLRIVEDAPSLVKK